MIRIETIKENDYRNIYVVGDIHGMYSLLDNALIKIGFSKEKDLIICAGDLINRGNESEKAIYYLNQKWFKSVLGNHDITFFDPSNNLLLHPEYYPETLNIVNSNLFSNFLDTFNQLPLIIEYQPNEGLKSVISHAALPIMENYDNFRRHYLINNNEKNELKKIYKLLIWHRSYFDLYEKIKKNENDFIEFKLNAILKRYYPTIHIEDYNNKEKINLINNHFTIKDLKAVYHGHNINNFVYENKFKDGFENSFCLGNRYYIDTGAFHAQYNYLYDFTIFNIKTNKCVYTFNFDV